MADETTGVTDLGHVAGALALVGAAAVPDLVVEDRHRAGWSESGEDLVLVGRAFDWIGRRRTEEVRAWYDLGGALCDLVEIGQHVVAGEKQYGQTDIGRWFAFGDQEVGWIVLMPGADAAAGWGAEAVVVDDVAMRLDQRLGEGNDGLEVEEAQIGGALLEHAVLELGAGSGWAGLERSVEVGAKVCSQRGRQDVFEKEIAVAVELFDPFLNLVGIGWGIGEVLSSCHTRCSSACFVNAARPQIQAPAAAGPFGKIVEPWIDFADSLSRSTLCGDPPYRNDGSRKLGLLAVRTTHRGQAAATLAAKDLAATSDLFFA